MSQREQPDLMAELAFQMLDRVPLCPAHFAQKAAGLLMRGILYDVISRPKDEGEACRACEVEEFHD